MITWNEITPEQDAEWKRGLLRQAGLVGRSNFPGWIAAPEPVRLWPTVASAIGLTNPGDRSEEVAAEVSSEEFYNQMADHLNERLQENGQTPLRLSVFTFEGGPVIEWSPEPGRYFEQPDQQELLRDVLSRGVPSLTEVRQAALAVDLEPVQQTYRDNLASVRAFEREQALQPITTGQEMLNDLKFGVEGHDSEANARRVTAAQEVQNLQAVASGDALEPGGLERANLVVEHHGDLKAVTIDPRYPSALLPKLVAGGDEHGMYSVRLDQGSYAWAGDIDEKFASQITRDVQGKLELEQPLPPDLRTTEQKRQAMNEELMIDESQLYSGEKGQLRQWFDEGKIEEHDFMIIVRDGYDAELRPEYIDSFNQETTSEVLDHIRGKGDKAMEVYDLSFDREVQLAEPRAWNHELTRLTEPADIAVREQRLASEQGKYEKNVRLWESKRTEYEGRTGWLPEDWSTRVAMLEKRLGEMPEDSGAGGRAGVQAQLDSMREIRPPNCTYAAARPIAPTVGTPGQEKAKDVAFAGRSAQAQILKAEVASAPTSAVVAAPTVAREA